MLVVASPAVAAGVLMLACCARIGSATPITLDPTTASHVYDGHGALSAGASSRLLYDYPEQQRSDILDLLFKPNFGANLHHIKVEIGGDGQSTDGTEPSHMHERDDLSCDRGYEFWLLEEARKRNPAIKTYALSWAAPAWVGNQTSFYSQDEIDYHIKWLECTKKYDIGSIDYIGNWNERSWGPPNWTVAYRAAMDLSGFAETKIVIPDGGDTAGIEKAMAADATFAAAVDGLGVHYPCNDPVPTIQGEFGKKYWSSEDYSTVGDWAGAACWGRLLNQNFVRMNQTSTIAWSLIWSVYNPGFPYFGNGLMYAFTPWSGSYEAGLPGSSNGGAIWTNAHSGQFSAPGWRFLSVEGGGSGVLPGGGSYVAMVSPAAADAAPHVTLVVEKLQGRCLRCAGQTTTAEAVEFVLAGALAAHTVLQVWQTNETAHFVSLGNVTASAATGAFGPFEVQPDSIVTFSSWFNGQAKGSVVVPPPAPFPLKLADNFDSYPVDAEARYFADNGGSFQIAEDPIAIAGRGGGANQVLKQWVMRENGVNRWGSNVNPVSLLGNATWSDVSVSAKVLIGATPAPGPAPAPVPPGAGAYLQNQFSGLCLDTRGRAASPGAAVDQWTCVNADNERYVHDTVTGHLIGQNSRLCVSDSKCASGGSLCIQPCGGSDAVAWDVAPVAAGSRTTTGAVTVSKRGANASGAECLQTAAKTLDSSVFVGACTAPHTPQQQWTLSTAPPVSPTGPGDVYAGVCVRADTQGAGTCLTVNSTGGWRLAQDGRVLSEGVVAAASGEETAARAGTKAAGVDVASGGSHEVWTSLELTASGSTVTPVVNGKPQPPQTGTGAGMVAVVSGYHIAYFDDFELNAQPPAL